VDQKTSFLHGLAWAVSVVFHPIFLFTWLVYLITIYFPDLLIPIATSGFANLILVALIGTAIVPSLIVCLYMVLVKKQIKIQALFMLNKEDRQIPLIFLATYYTSLSYMLFMGLNNILYIIMVALVGLILFIGIVNFFWKISNHAAGMGAALGVLLLLNLTDIQHDILIPVLTTLVVSGLVLSARLFLNAHKPKEVYLGYLSGIITCSLILSGFYFFQ